jgi:ParD-like antitoxin of type II bacterial toxin-antitoxin system
MSQPVKLSDSLVLDARLTGEIAQRSIAGQIEFWAGLGRAVETVLRGGEVLALQKAGAVRPLAARLETVDSPEGRARVSKYLQSLPFPHYEAAHGQPGLLLRIDADGTRTLGRFVNRRFELARPSADAAAAA